MVDARQVAEWTGAVGRTESRKQFLDQESLSRYSLALGGKADVGQSLPPLAHWAFFLPGPADNELGPDGHPRRGGFLPGISMPRRMFAGSEISFVGPLEIGELAEMTNTISDVSHKSGRSGDLVFVEVKRELAQGGTARIIERQHFVYRDVATGVLAMPIPSPQQPEGEIWQPDSVNLFRFSAATFNSHRIHYDLPYTIETEGYPALVVHGPFTAAKLAGMAARKGELAGFSFRAVAPLFLGQPAYLRQTEENAVEAVRCDGQVSTTAQVVYA